MILFLHGMAGICQKEHYYIQDYQFTKIARLHCQELKERTVNSNSETKGPTLLTPIYMKILFKHLKQYEIIES